jgi:hypothetical protein
MKAELHDYEAFLARKAFSDPPTGLSRVPALNAQLFDFQRDIVRLGASAWACGDLRGLRHGQDADAARMGAARVPPHGRRRADPRPAGGGAADAREGAKFDRVEALRALGGRRAPGRINIANYEMLHHFDPAHFAGSCWTSRASSKPTTARRAPRSSKRSASTRSGLPARRPRPRTITWSWATTPSSWA